jgi:hypothetical protein
MKTKFSITHVLLFNLKFEHANCNRYYEFAISCNDLIAVVDMFMQEIYMYIYKGELYLPGGTGGLRADV